MDISVWGKYVHVKMYDRYDFEIDKMEFRLSDLVKM